MLKVPVDVKEFDQPNLWSVTNGLREVEFRFPALVHAAITAGRHLGWRRQIQSDIGGLAELLWKQYAFLTSVHESIVDRKPTGTIQRLGKTETFDRMDPSERRGLTYHLGNAMATAWARVVLGVPWLLHLDVYGEHLGVQLQLGNSRPDLIGRDRQGHWIVIESKGRSSPPSQAAEDKAKLQAGRVTSIGGVAPALHLAAFTFFSTDRSARGRAKPKIVTMRVIDPLSEGNSEDTIRLDGLNEVTFFELYYQSWAFLFQRDAILHAEGPLLWRDIKDLDIRIGIVAGLRDALTENNFTIIPRIITDMETSLRPDQFFPYWAGDGIFIEPGDSWKELFKSRKV